jgi:hypothetical protein
MWSLRNSAKWAAQPARASCGWPYEAGWRRRAAAPCAARQSDPRTLARRSLGVGGGGRVCSPGVSGKRNAAPSCLLPIPTPGTLVLFLKHLHVSDEDQGQNLILAGSHSLLMHFVVRGLPTIKPGISPNLWRASGGRCGRAIGGPGSRQIGGSTPCKAILIEAPPPMISARCVPALASSDRLSFRMQRRG